MAALYSRCKSSPVINSDRQAVNRTLSCYNRATEEDAACAIYYAACNEGKSPCYHHNRGTGTQKQSFVMKCACELLWEYGGSREARRSSLASSGVLLLS